VKQDLDVAVIKPGDGLAQHYGCPIGDGSRRGEIFCYRRDRPGSATLRYSGIEVRNWQFGGRPS
jgi:hypothetical protein